MKADRTMKWLGIGLYTIAMLSPRFFIIRPNRIIDGILLGSKQALDGVFWPMLFLCIVMLVSIFIRNKFASSITCLVASIFAAIVLLLRAVTFSGDLSSQQFPEEVTVINPALSLSMGFYLMIIGLFFIVRASLLDLTNKRWSANLLAIGGFLLFGISLAKQGSLDHISIYIEMSRNWSSVLYELGRHLKLSLLSVLVGLLISIGLGIWAYRRKNFENIIFKLIILLRSSQPYHY
jgi:hypothetical protein